MLNAKNRSEAISYITLACLGMLYITLVLCSAVLTNKVVAIGPAITLAGVLIVPFIFCTADIMAELFGYKIASITVQLAFVFQLIFAVLCTQCIKLPSPDFWHGAVQYQFVFAPLMKMSVASFVAYIIASTINVYVISKWRVRWRGKYFWIRSLGSSSMAEFLYTILIILLMQYHVFPGSTLLRMMVTSYVIKVVFSFCCSIPANMLVFGLKKLLGKYDVESNYEYKSPFVASDKKLHVIE